MGKIKDITNQKFGKLTVLRHSHFIRKKSDGYPVHFWLCKCECGNEKTIRGDSLRKGATKGCGCIRYQVGRNNSTWKGYEDISATFWKQIKWSADNRKIPLEITIEQCWDLFVKQDKKCALTGLTLSFPKNARDITSNASLDRIDSKKGYTIDNVQWVDKRVNFMKITLDNDEFIKLCKLVTIKAEMAV